MTRVVIWKEIREQLAILLTLVVMGAGIIITAAALAGTSSAADPFDARSMADPAHMAILILTMVGGLVCGSMAFANEHENGTIHFLVALPANRHRLWWSKLAAASILTSSLAVLFTIIGLAVGLYPWTALPVWMILLWALAMAAMASGFLGSVLTPFVIAACGIGIVLGPLVANLSSGIAYVFIRMYGGEYSVLSGEMMRPTAVLVIAPFVTIVVMLLFSYFAYVRDDWARRKSLALPVRREKVEFKESVIAPYVPRSRYGLRSLAWLSHRQWFVPACVLFAMATVFGGIMAIPDVPIIFFWPITTAILGCVAGVMVFAPEQMAGAARYWAEQRLPVRRVWCVKVMHALIILFSALFIMFVPPLITMIASRQGGRPDMLVSLYFRSLLINWHGPVMAMLFLWPAYTFAASLVAGMCFRKPIVSLSVGLMAGASLASLWIPSMLSGGMQNSLLWPAPIVAILGSFWLMTEWSQSRVGSTVGLTKLAVIVVASLGLVAAGIAYRWTEVPECPEIEDDLKFVETIPVKDDKNPGQDFKRIVTNVRLVIDDLGRDQAMKTLPGRLAPWTRRSISQTETIGQQIHEFSTRLGYPADRPDLDRYFVEFNKKTREVNDDWKMIRTKATGVIVDPRDVDVTTLLPELDNSRQFSFVMTLRGLREQAYGRPEKYLDDLDSCLAMTRSMRSKTIFLSALTSSAVESSVLQSIPLWLARLDHEPAVLKKSMLILDRHAQEPEPPIQEYQYADLTTHRNALRNPQSWYPKLSSFGFANMPKESSKEKQETEANLLQFAWNVPWEKERMRRALGLANAATLPKGAKEPEEYLNGLPGYSLFLDFPGGKPKSWLRNTVPIGSFANQAMRRQATVNGMRILVALRLFQAEKGRPAKLLEELVPDYLPEVPIDPYSQKPFRYELSAGGSRVVYLERLDELRTAPGMDLEPALTNADWMDLTAVMGGLINFPRPPEPKYEPGYGPGASYDEDEMNAFASVVGGVLRWPSGLEYPTQPDEVMAGAGPGGPGWEPSPLQPVFVAGLGGMGAEGLSRIPDLNPIGEEANPFLRYTAQLKPMPVPAGQGIVWSVGHDFIDDGGMWQVHVAGNRGDLIWLVPSAVKWVPMRDQEK